jgi:hypothetical protein
MTTPKIDAVFLSYDEPLANDLHRQAEILLGPIKRLHGVSGMRRAYRLTAEMVDSDEYLILDGDFAIAEAVDLSRIEPLPHGVSMRVWKTVNPVNGLEYGYGGMKLCRRSAMRAMSEKVDVLAGLPGQVEFTAEVAGYTRFNQSPYHTWRAGFRECSMLSRGSEYGMSASGTDQRIAAWLNSARGDFSAWARQGAADGVAFARQSGGDFATWDLINDPDWLLERFDARTAKREEV